MAIAENDLQFMECALDEAEKAFEEDEVPVGAVIARGNEILARNHNRVIQSNDPSAHAEILVLREAGKITGNYRLNDTT